MKGSIWQIGWMMCVVGFTLGLVACAFKKEVKKEIPPEIIAEMRIRPKHFIEKTGGRALIDSNDTIWFNDWAGTIRIMRRDTVRWAIIVPVIPDSGKYWIPGFGVLPDSIGSKFIEDGMKIRFSGYQRWEDRYFWYPSQDSPAPPKYEFMRTVIKAIREDR